MTDPLVHEYVTEMAYDTTVSRGRKFVTCSDGVQMRVKLSMSSQPSLIVNRNEVFSMCENTLFIRKFRKSDGSSRVSVYVIPSSELEDLANKKFAVTSSVTVSISLKAIEKFFAWSIAIDKDDEDERIANAKISLANELGISASRVNITIDKRRSRPSIQTTKRVAQAVSELLKFTKPGDLRIAEIARAAGVSTATVSNVGSKADLIAMAT